MLESVVGRDFLPRGSGKSPIFVFFIFFLCINDLLYLFMFSPLFANLRDFRGIGRCVIMLDFSFLLTGLLCTQGSSFWLR